MASIRSYKNGAGGSSGADLACLFPQLTSGVFWFVGNSVAGNSDSNTGTERAKPFATTAHAVASASSNDTVVLLGGHNEVISTALVISLAGLAIVGEGTGLSVPRLTCGGTVAMLDITAADVTLDNIYFPASSAVPTARVRCASSGCDFNALQFDCGLSDTNRALSLITGAGKVRINNSRFTSVAATPAVGLEVINAVAGLSMNNNTFDGGSFGFSDYAFKGSAAVTDMRVKRTFLLNGANVLLPTGTTGSFNAIGVNGDSQINWTP